MLRTYYAGGRDKLPAPVITLNTGVMNGNNTVYYFWIKARNRVGYNLPSNSTSLTITAGKSLSISNANFTQLPFEDWHEFIITMGTVDDFTESRVIYRYQVYDENGNLNPVPNNIVLNNQYYLSIPIVNTPNDLPQFTLSNGYRLRVNSLNQVYEYNVNSSKNVDGLSVLEAPGTAQWHIVTSSNITETSTNYNKELYQVNETELLAVKLAPDNTTSKAVMYYITNTDTAALEAGQLDLNIYKSDSALDITANIEVIGYLDMTTKVLDTTNIPYIGSVINYPATKINLSKPLNSNHSLVIKVLPVINTTLALAAGHYFTFYPRLNEYITVNSIDFWGDAVSTIAELQALPASSIKDGLSVQIKSVNRIYTYNQDSTLEPDGDSVIQPAFNPITGRWESNSSVILNESVTLEKLSPSLVDMLDDTMQVVFLTVNAATTYNIDFDSIEAECIVLTTPDDDGNDTILNFNYDSLTNNTTHSKLLELSQRTGVVTFHSSILFPGGNTPLLSGAGKTDLFVLTIRKDGQGNIKKRASLAQKNIG